MKTKPFTVAAIQHPPVFLNLEASVDRAVKLIEEAAGNGAKVIAFPETWLPGYPVWLDVSPKAVLWDYPPARALYRILSDNALVIGGTQFNRLLAAAGKTGTYVVMGANEKVGGTIYNSLIYFDSIGVNFAVHRKLIPTYAEQLVWGRGDGSTLAAIETEFGVLGGLICWEHWMPLLRAAMHAEREILHIAQWPGARELHQIASRHYAFEGQCFVVAASLLLRKSDIIDGAKSLGSSAEAGLVLLDEIPGESQDYIINGGSSIIAPNGSYLVEPVYERADIIYADIDPDLAAEAHLVLDTDGHYSRPDIFSLRVNRREQKNVSDLPDPEY